MKDWPDYEGEPTTSVVGPKLDRVEATPPSQDGPVEPPPPSPDKPITVKLHGPADRYAGFLRESMRAGMDMPAGTTELSASGLEPDQEIRAEALSLAITWVGHHWIGGTNDRNGILDVADELADYIRDGSKPS